MVLLNSPMPATSSSDAATQNGGVSSNDIGDKNNQHILYKSIPQGKYTIVSIDIDTTGRRLIDEIVQLAAFTPNEQFGQYIMPYMNLNPAARQRHQVRVISIGFYRMLKSTQTYKIIKSKSEIAALRDFLNWLEAVKARDNSSQGIILVYYEERKFIPYMILESLKKYNLLDRFLNTVRSFANGLNLAKNNADAALQHFSLRKLSKHLKDNLNNNKIECNNNVTTSSPNTTELEQTDKQHLNGKRVPRKSAAVNNVDEAFDGNASVRAKLAYEVTWHLSNLGSKEAIDSINAIDKMLTELQPHATHIECDMSELQIQNKNLERQNSFRPVFLNYFKTTLYHRVRAVKFRIILAEHAYDLQTLNNIWEEKKRDGIAEILQSIEELKLEEKNELADLFDSFFDPAKSTIKPVVKTNRRRNRRVRNNNGNGNSARSAGNEQDIGGDKEQVAAYTAPNLPDSTTKSPRNQRGKRRSRLFNYKNLSKPQQTSNNPTNSTNHSDHATMNSMTAKVVPN